uniref:Ras-GEF domain-containing family member 1B n=1 Tax=Timema monikensis TaxID=170555 RepID=A0A7R9HMU4_9NEOP|nr:unnamed protein product [Timema monikensis]
MLRPLTPVEPLSMVMLSKLSGSQQAGLLEGNSSNVVLVALLSTFFFFFFVLKNPSFPFLRTTQLADKIGGPRKSRPPPISSRRFTLNWRRSSHDYNLELYSSRPVYHKSDTLELEHSATEVSQGLLGISFIKALRGVTCSETSLSNIRYNRFSSDYMKSRIPATNRSGSTSALFECTIRYNNVKIQLLKSSYSYKFYPPFRGGIVENYLWEKTLSTPIKDSNHDLPAISGLVHCESSALDHAATETTCPPVCVALGSKPLRSEHSVQLCSFSSYCEHHVHVQTIRDDGTALVYRDGGNLVSGSLDALVQHMVPTADYYPDRAYLFAFLLSSRLFIKPHELLGEVCELCDQQQKLGDKHGPAKERLGRFVPHLVQLLAEWTETFPYDFRDERVMAHVRSLTQKCVTIEPGIRKEVSTLLQNLLHRLTTLEKYEEFLHRVNSESSTSCVDSLSTLQRCTDDKLKRSAPRLQMDVTELCPNPALLAQQLTHIELERLSYIGPEEFVQAFAKENPHLETSFKDMKKTRNLESYVQWFNRLSYFVATEVCKHVKKKQRVKVMEYWIETARECFNIGNFNSLMAVIAGLNMSPISRLKKTWSKVQSAKFSILEHQMDPSSNFSSYRSTLKAAMWRSAGATDERQRIVIPFFSLLVKDLYFLNEGCSSKSVQ